MVQASSHVLKKVFQDPLNYGLVNLWAKKKALSSSTVQVPIAADLGRTVMNPSVGRKYSKTLRSMTSLLHKLSVLTVSLMELSNDIINMMAFHTRVSEISESISSYGH